MSQTHSPVADAWTPAQLQAVIDAHSRMPGAMLPTLHAIQDRFGFIPDAAVPMIAEALRHTRAEVHGIISFYHHFRTHPPGRSVIQICRAEACQSVGSRQLEAHARKALGIDYHQTTPDHEFTLEPVYCLGNCACGPSVRVNDDVYGRMSPEQFDQLTDELSATVVEVK
ncbi:formate dehydrogenase subunit gamma [Kushneria indalinina]|uniref:NADH-quinone oxidoreductase subunit E n=1 Tax=Kushneria indalinina DSM 14324 TaxID=1122140 RepID=A0A3D9DS23_9GAMM|nr:formate dehydrogenase subunit gamma [Kushneria indalinina]REC93445.1 formate dehydrogenase gamma subunit [Kushneria indalinina DSM 14324]